MALFGGYIIYNTVFWSGFLHVTLPLIPLFICNSLRRNVLDNCETTIEKIDLLLDGESVRVKDLSG